jgi:hypothetical protein
MFPKFNLRTIYSKLIRFITYNTRPRKFWGFRESSVGSNLGQSSYAYETGLYEPINYGNEFYFPIKD